MVMSTPISAPLALDSPAQVARVLDAHAAAFDREDDLPRLRIGRRLAEENLAVDAVIRAFLFLHRPRADEAERSKVRGRHFNARRLSANRNGGRLSGEYVQRTSFLQRDEIALLPLGGFELLK